MGGIAWRRLPIEVESPEARGYESIAFNLAESSVREFALRELGVDIGAVVPVYGDHRGLPDLRASIAASAEGLTADDVLVTAGAAMALFVAATSLLGPGDRIIVVRPNYSTNIETPRALGASMDYLDLRFEDAWRVDTDEIDRRLKSGPALVSLTLPHNPTGVTLGREEFERIVRIVERRRAWLFVDETYREMTDDPLPAVAELSTRAVSIGSLSKAYGVPGIRIGWLLTRDQRLRERFLAAKEQICLTGSLVDEEIGLAVLRDRERWRERSRSIRRTGLEAVGKWLGTEARMEWVRPVGGVVGFPRIRRSVKVDIATFYQVLSESGTAVGPGRWFGQSDELMRIGFGWPTPEELAAGLRSISLALDASTGRARP
jgi:aspartate/methionine/tyrosine aminotransferase